MGIQVFFFPALCINFARDGVSQKARSVLCFMSIPAHAWFVVSEIMTLPNWPAAMPKEGLYFNIVLWTTFIILSYLGWKESGAALPDTDALIPKGRFGTP